MGITKKYNFNEQIFYNENEVSFYLLGAYTSDGNICIKKRNKSFSITSQDKDWLEAIKQIIESEHPIKPHGENCYELYIGSFRIAEWFIKWNCIPCKSKTLELSADIPDQYFKDFVRGVFDGDGCITTSSYKKIKPSGKEYFYKKLTCYICTASEAFAKSLHDKLQSLGISCSLIKLKSQINGKDCGFIYRIGFCERTAIKFIEWLYYPNHKISMNRKREIAMRELEAFKIKGNFSITPSTEPSAPQ